MWKSNCEGSPFSKTIRRPRSTTRTGTDIYSKLKDYQQTAVKNAEKLGEFSLTEGRQAVAEIGRVFNFIGS